MRGVCLTTGGEVDHTTFSDRIKWSTEIIELMETSHTIN